MISKNNILKTIKDFFMNIHITNISVYKADLILMVATNCAIALNFIPHISACKYRLIRIYTPDKTEFTKIFLYARLILFEKKSLNIKYLCVCYNIFKIIFPVI